MEVNPNVGEVATALAYIFWNYVFFPLDVTPVGWMQFMNFMLFLSSNKKNTLPRSSLYLDSFVVMNMLMTVQVKGGQANGDRRANATRLRYWKEISDPRLFPTKIDLVFACFRCIPVPCSLCMC